MWAGPTREKKTKCDNLSDLNNRYTCVFDKQTKKEQYDKNINAKMAT